MALRLFLCRADSWGGWGRIQLGQKLFLYGGTELPRFRHKKAPRAVVCTAGTSHSNFTAEACADKQNSAKSADLLAVREPVIKPFPTQKSAPRGGVSVCRRNARDGVYNTCDASNFTAEAHRG